MASECVHEFLKAQAQAAHASASLYFLDVVLLLRDFSQFYALRPFF